MWKKYLNIKKKIKEMNNFISDKNESIFRLNGKIKSLQILATKEGKLEIKSKKTEMSGDKKINIEKLQFHKFYQYDNEDWGLISNKINEHDSYKWINLKDVKINLNSNSMKKYF